MDVTELTEEVLKDRQQLDILVDNLQKKVKEGLSTLEEIKETSEKIKQYEAEIKKNSNFQIEVTVTKPFQIDISGTGQCITNCQVCHFTCHFPCGLAKEAEKKGCDAMGPDGFCTVCPAKCIWSVHYNQDYRWEYKTVTSKQTIEEIKKKYEEAVGAKASAEDLIRKLEKEYNKLQCEVVELIKKSVLCLNQLKELTLTPDPLSTAQYVDHLIQGERTGARPGWEKRVDILIIIRGNAEISNTEPKDCIDANKKHSEQKVDISSYFIVLLCYYVMLFIYVSLSVIVGGKGRVSSAD